MNNLSLSKFIDLPDVKAKLRQEFVKPRFSVNKPLLAPSITLNPPKIGTAFDYLLRFYANYLNLKAISSQWTAEESLKILELSGLFYKFKFFDYPFTQKVAEKMGVSASKHLSKHMMYDAARHMGFDAIWYHYNRIRTHSHKKPEV